MQAREKDVRDLNDVGVPAIKRIQELRRHLGVVGENVVRDTAE
jgi:hypothetical protein